MNPEKVSVEQNIDWGSTWLGRLVDGASKQYQMTNRVGEKEQVARKLDYLEKYELPDLIGAHVTLTSPSGQSEIAKGLLKEIDLNNVRIMIASGRKQKWITFGEFSYSHDKEYSGVLPLVRLFTTRAYKY
ncbi:MAG: hypothetical protein ACYDBX_02115 [Patescibacteria group bacterium]